MERGKSRNMDPYALAKDRPPCRKRDVVAEPVVIFGNKREDRGLKLITSFTRAVLLNEIHEFILTDEKEARPTATVNRIAYLCFAEIKKGGAIMFGDNIVVQNRIIGRVVGFDETHMPNHLNVIIYTDERQSGFELELSVGQRMIITDQY
jgi:hypothetical protein